MNDTLAPIAAEWPAPADTQGVLLFGGTFDPPHRAHAQLAVHARDLLERSGDLPADSWLVLVPAARSPHKDHGPEASDEDRSLMLAIAMAGIPRTAIWTTELLRARTSSGASRWIDTLREARAGRNGIALRFLIGDDQAAVFHRWHDATLILSLAEPVVAQRNFADRHALLNHLRTTDAWTDAQLDDWSRWILDQLPLLPDRATEIRAALAGSGSGKPSPNDSTPLAEELDEGVLRFIRLRGLYRRSPRHRTP